MLSGRGRAVAGSLIGAFFFVSGFTGLVYEVIWAKYLALLLGSTAAAQVGVLAVFMGGLAIGSVVWGAQADRSRQALRIYGVLEVGIGLCAALFVFSFDGLARTYWAALATVTPNGLAAASLKIGLCVAAMLAPTFCMGGTLPVLSRVLVSRSAELGRGVAYLYAVNSLGAALGAVLTGFFLVAEWGLDAPFLAAAGVNGGVGVLAILLAGRWQNTAPEAASNAVSNADSLGDRAVVQAAEDVWGHRALLLTGAAVAGGVAMIYEVAWIRLCGLVLGSSTYSFSIMLAAFITGIALGSSVYSLVEPARRRPLRFFVVTSLASVVILLACLAGYDRLPYELGRLTAYLRSHDVSFAVYQAATLLFCLTVMFPLTFVSGLNFPALVHAAGQSRGGVGRPVSQVLFANTLGTICGAVGGGLYLLPAVGLRGTFLVGIAATVAVAVLVLMADREIRRRTSSVIAAAAVLGVGAYIILMPAWDQRLLVAGEFRQHEGIEAESFGAYRDSLKQEVTFYQDGVDATVSVERQPPDDVVLRVNGKADASAFGDADTELLSGHLPAVLNPAARRVLVIGWGSGVTVGALLRHPVESVDVVEISRSVIAADEQFRPYNHDALHDPRVHVFVEDARTFLYQAQGGYDIVISEPSNPWIAGIGNLFTVEFFEQVRSRLAPDGILLQWFHTYETTDRLIALILRTVTYGFGDVSVFQPNRWDVFVVAAPAKRMLEPAAMARAFARADELRTIGITRLPTLLALGILGDESLRRLAGDGSVNRDRRPVLEYAAPRAFFDGRNASLLASNDGAAAVPFADRGCAGVDDYKDAVGYLQRADMMHYPRAMHLLAEWLACAPSDVAAQQILNWWMTVHSDAPLLLHALAQAPLSSDGALQTAYAMLVLRVVGSLHLTPSAADIAIVEPTVRTVAAGDARGGLLLRQLGDLYFAAGAYAPALRSFDAALQLPEGSDRSLQCERALALDKLGDSAAAATALQRCHAGDAADATADRAAPGAN